MSCSIKQNTDGSTGFAGPGGGSGEFLNINIEYNAASVDKTSFVATRRYIVKAVTARPTVIGTDAGAVTAAVKIAASGTAITAGTAVHSGTADLKGTANTNQTLTLSTTLSELILPAGSCLGVDFTGVLTAATGIITVSLCPG